MIKNYPKCELCYHFDEFLVCHKCFQKYREKSIHFRKLINNQKHILKTSIQDMLLKNNQIIYSFNRISQKRVKIEKIQHRLSEIETSIKIKNNMVIMMSEKIRKKKENLKIIQEYLDYHSNKLVSDKLCLNKHEFILNSFFKNSQTMKKFYSSHLAKLIFKVVNDFEVENYLEIHEYLKPDINTSNLFTNNNSNEFENFEKITNVLSMSKLGTNLNTPNKEYDMNSFKFYKIKADIYKNKHKILYLNRFILALIFFLKNLSEFLNIQLPYKIDNYFIKNNFNDKAINLIISDISNQNENCLHEIMQGYIYLDLNLKHLLNVTGSSTLKNVKKYKNGLSYGSQHLIFTPDIKEFLNITDLLPFTTLDNKIKEPESVDMNLLKKNIPREEDGFVIIDNYYI